MEHALAIEGQPIADQLMGKCSCGWRLTASFYEFPTRDEAVAKIDREFATHVATSDGGNGTP